MAVGKWWCWEGARRCCGGTGWRGGEGRLAQRWAAVQWQGVFGLGLMVEGVGRRKGVRVVVVGGGASGGRGCGWPRWWREEKKEEGEGRKKEGGGRRGGSGWLGVVRRSEVVGGGGVLVGSREGAEGGWGEEDRGAMG
nr:uncharacterized protein LOC112778654 [Arachis hypogaea]